MTQDREELKRLAEAAKPYWGAVDQAFGGNPIAAELVMPFAVAVSPATVLALLSDLEAMQEENARLNAGLDEIQCWFGEAPHTFPDWKTTAEALAAIAENVRDGLPPLATAEQRQALTAQPDHHVGG